jgi:hypothetical protein
VNLPLAAADSLRSPLRLISLGTERHFVNVSQRLGAWTAAGWLGMVGGAFAALMSGGALVLGTVLAVQGRPLRVRHGDTLPGYLPLLYADVRILPGLFLVAAVLAFIAGLGLVRRRPYGRTLTLVFGALSIAWFLFACTHLWLMAVAPVSHGSSFFFRLAPAVFTTPVALAYCVAVGLLCRSVLRHPESFTSGASRGA